MQTDRRGGSVLTLPAPGFRFRRVIRDSENWDAGGADLSAVLDALSELPPYAGIGPEVLEPLRAKGLIHAHVRVRGTGKVLRIPRLSSFGFPPNENLAYQAACFGRAVASGHVVCEL